MSPVERPRVEGDREDEILRATVDLLTSVGYDRLTMDAVAREARASKATLYRRWESKAMLVIDALMRSKGMPEIEDVDTGSLRGDLIATFCGKHGIISAKTTSVLGAVVTAVSTDPEFAAIFRERFVAPKARVSRNIYKRAIERGEASPDLDLEIIVPALAGVCLHRMFMIGEQPDDATVERVIDNLILPAVLAQPLGTAPKSNPRTKSRNAR